MEATAATLERRVRVIPATRKPEELHRDHDGKMRVSKAATRPPMPMTAFS